MKECTVPITISIPAFNASLKILDCLYAILQSAYTNVYIIVVDDGSEDSTLEVLNQEFDLFEIPPAFQIKIPSASVRRYYQSKKYSNLRVIAKEHGPANNGADCHNAALNCISTPLFATVDVDTILEPEALTNVLYGLLSQKHCIAAGGVVHTSNGNHCSHGRIETRHIPSQFIPGIQCLEYYRSFTYGRTGLNILAGAYCFSGAFTLFETKSVLLFGGFDSENYAYDAEIILRLQHRMRQLKYPTRLRFVPNAAAGTHVPNSWKSFWIQRNRWQRGMLLSAYKHKAMFFNPKYGFLGLVTFPSFIVIEIFGPVVEFLSYFLLGFSLYLGILSWEGVAWFVFLAWGYLVLITIATFYLSILTFKTFGRASSLLRAIWLVTRGIFGFRQFRATCYFWGTMQFIINRFRGKSL